MNKDKTILNQFLLRAIRNEIWSANLRDTIREKHVSLDRIARECNLVVLERSQEKAAFLPKFRFQERSDLREVNKLKLFIESPLYFGESFGPNTLENIAAKLKVWIIHPEYGELIGREDAEAIFPGYRPSAISEARIISISIQRGFVVYDREKRNLFITAEGQKLGKVQEALKHAQAKISDPISGYRE
jgi:hypothetical protein